MDEPEHEQTQRQEKQKWEDANDLEAYTYTGDDQSQLGRIQWLRITCDRNQETKTEHHPDCIHLK